MNQRQSRQLAHGIVNNEKWWDILSRLIDVLRINIFIVDTQGAVILPSKRIRYGGRLLSDPSLKFDLRHDMTNILQQFDQYGKFLESINRYELHCFALPIDVTVSLNHEQTVAYMIVGPVVLNKRLGFPIYQELSQEYGSPYQDLMDEINEVRVVSNVMMNSILELLSDIVRNHVDLMVKEKKIDKGLSRQENVTKGIEKIIHEIYSTVRLDELLVTLLDVALKMTQAEGGSIMVVDDKRKDLTIKVSKGLDEKRIENRRIKLGQGISGLAAQEKSSFVISPEKCDNRIAHLLKRPDIKKSFVMPLVSKNRVFGVLNIHTSKERDKIEDNIDNLNYLSKLLSSVF